MLQLAKRAACRHLPRTQVDGSFRRIGPAIAAAYAAMGAVSAEAGTVDLGNGVEMVWAADASLTEGWRASNPNQSLIGPLGGGTNSVDTGTFNELNWNKGDNFTNLLRLVGEAKIRKGDTGLFVRAKAWDNFALSSHSVRYGAPTNDFQADARLSDADFDTHLSKFRGAELLDLYGFTRFKLSDTVSGDVKFGQLAMNWGESLFVPGVNAYSVLDVNALRQPGTLIKEAILPVPQLALSLQLPEQFQLEAFYQFKWKKTSVDGCGTYWSPSGSLNCSNRGLLVPQTAVPGPGGTFLAWPDLRSQWLGGSGAVLLGPNFAPLGAPLVPVNTVLPKQPDRDASDSGQFGLSMKKYVSALDTEFGAYFVNYHSHTPFLSFVRDNNTLPGSIWASPALGSMFWDYAAENIKVFGLSASTVVGGWAVAGEVVHSTNIPVQINGPDLFVMSILGAGPVAGRNQPLQSGNVINGFDRKSKSQINLSTVKSFGNVLGASTLDLVGEVAFQHWSGIGDPFTSVRYGRDGEYGVGAHATLGGAAACGFPGSPINSVAENCSTDGYATANAWGVRVQVSAEYPRLIPGVVVKPRLFVSQDVKGWSADDSFRQGRRAVSVGSRFVYEQRYFLDMSYTTYNRNAHFDNLNDRAFFGLVVGASF